MSYAPHSIAVYENQTDQNSFGVYGQAVCDFGLCVQGGIDGVGLFSRGLIWQGPEIWSWPWDTDGISTSWSDPVGTLGAAFQASGSVGFYRASKAYGPYSVPSSTIVQTSTGIQFNFFNNSPSFSNTDSTVFAISGSFNVAPTSGAIYADNNGTQFTVFSSGFGFITATGATRAPYGMGVYTAQTGGVLTKISGTGDASIAYISVANTDYYIFGNGVAIIPGTTGNVAQNAVTTIVSQLADTNVVILDSQGMTGGDGTGWVPAQNGIWGEFSP